MTIKRDQLHQTDFAGVVAEENHEAPVSPGEILHEEFMQPLALSASALARELHVPANRITGVINGQRNLTADTALRLARYFGTTPEFWMRLQADYELRQARQNTADTIEREITPRVA
ncbi:addiction module HigA family antidote [Halospina denitrificans]|uniref:Addiction module HigA family antidote n=1 Tax=Halospina denitrificans TaxID=332522 RepID=A0A4R7JXV4_9GAMM|nr:HigA family addiction module antitoxin [Halospina denitrificans]TDT42995.1 addiction module HigA family antidote [Halospina denitrificans]